MALVRLPKILILLDFNNFCKTANSYRRDYADFDEYVVLRK